MIDDKEKVQPAPHQESGLMIMIFHPRFSAGITGKPRSRESHYFSLHNHYKAPPYAFLLGIAQKTHHVP